MHTYNFVGLFIFRSGLLFNSSNFNAVLLIFPATFEKIEKKKPLHFRRDCYLGPVTGYLVTSVCPPSYAKLNIKHFYFSLSTCVAAHNTTQHTMGPSLEYKKNSSETSLGHRWPAHRRTARSGQSRRRKLISPLAKHNRTTSPAEKKMKHWRNKEAKEKKNLK